MSAEKTQNESAKFVIGEEYTKDEFLYRLERLKFANASNIDLTTLLQEDIAWAERHHAETIFFWEEANNGYIYPHTVIGSEIFSTLPDGPIVD